MNRPLVKTITPYVALAFVVVLMCATGANAQQNTFQGRFTLPYEVHWCNAVLPAGDYSITIPSLNSLGRVRSEKGGTELLISTGFAGDIEGKTAHLTVMSRNGALKIVSMNLPSLNLSLTYAPMSEEEHKSQVAMRFPVR